MIEPVGIPVWNKDSRFALIFNKFITWPLGVWPLDYDSVFSNFRLLFTLFSQVWFIFVQITPAYLHCGNASDTVSYVMMSMVTVMAMSKIITFRIHMDKIRPVFLTAMRDWVVIDDEEDRPIMKSFAETGRFVFKMQIGFAYISMVLVSVTALPFLQPPMVTNESISNMSDVTETTIVRELPGKTGCLFGHYRDEIYGFLFVYESIMLTMTLHGNVGCDVFLFSLLMHICGQIELMKKYSRKIGTDVEKSVDPKEIIRTFIQKHKKILEMIRDIGETASGMLVVILFCNAGIILMMGLGTIMAVENGLMFEAMSLFIATGILMLQLYLLSYASDRLCSQSASIVEAIYESNWYELPTKLRKSLCFVAMRANRPENLVAGQFYVLNIENFKNILKASFSYFSVLRVMFDT